jgi:alginate O-acetyltransferase complex protein AlgJ
MMVYMKNFIQKKWRISASLVGLFSILNVNAAEEAPGIIGKNEWLFYRYELTEPSHESMTETTLDLIQRFNKVLAANEVTLALTMVPLKMRIYAEQLPDDIKLNDYTAGNAARMNKALKIAQVNVLDLNTAFMNSSKLNSERPLFFRLDSHWAPSGVLVAAEAIKNDIYTNSLLKNALTSTAQTEFKMVMGSKPRASKGRDLIAVLPKNSPTFPIEQVFQMSVSRTQSAKDDLLSTRSPAGIALVGSSYSKEWTGFPDALRFMLQRDILSVSVGADQGSWVGMESYVSDDAFQSSTPKILIWEMPERDMRAPPDFKFREARYIQNNTEWLLRASAWVQRSCKPSAVTAKLAPVGLAENNATANGNDFATGDTTESDFIEINFNKPTEILDYLAARITMVGSKKITLEASGPGAETRRFTVNVPGDDAPHVFKTPLPAKGKGFSKIRIYPGKNNSFALQNLQICRQPEELLK